MKSKKETIWTKDITHHVVATLAVFGLVVSAFVTTLGVTVIGVQAQVAFGAYAGGAQTASVELSQQRPASVILLPNASSTQPRLPGAGKANEHNKGADMGMASSSRPMVCPMPTHTIVRGDSEATTTGNVGQLQQFIANHFGLDPKEMVTGYFGSTTESYLKKFQQEQGIPPAPTVGPLTRAAIARLCNPSSMDDKSVLKGKDASRPADIRNGSTTIGSTTPPGAPMPHRDDLHMGSTTNTENRARPLPPPPALPATPPLPQTPPVSYNPNSSNAASVIEAVNQIGDGYGKLLSATLSIVGL